MAKGDDSRARNQIDYQNKYAQGTLDNLWALNADHLGQINNRFQGAADQNTADYGNIMNRYQEFADTGGYSPDDIANMRSRAISPTRAVYSNAQRNVNRQRALQGGYSPGFGALQGRMAREQSQGMSDASTNVEAQLAEMKQRGRLAGIGGMAQAYGTTPGMTSMYGNMYNQRLNALTDLQGLQNQLGLGTMNAQIGASQIPGKWENTVGRIGDIFDIGQKVAGAF
jgi:hypothetical protein